MGAWIRTACATVLLFGLAGSSSVTLTSAQKQAPPYRAGVELVHVPVVVQDKKGQPIDDLDASTFELYDEKHAVAVSAFAHVVVPSRLGLAPELPGPASATSSRPDDGSGLSRVFVIVFDDLHTASQHAAVTARIARRFVEAWVRPGDQIGIRQVSESGPLLVETAGDKRRVMSAIGQFAGRGKGNVPLVDQERVIRAERVLGALGSVAQVSSYAPARRVIVLFLSEGIDYDIFNVNAGGSRDVVRSTESAIAALRRANVVLYAIDPRGLASADGAVVETGGGAFQSRASVDMALADPDTRLSMSRLSLRHLAEETGGFAAVNSNDFGPALDRIGGETSNYYLLGFYPADGNCDGGFRRIRVKVRRSRVRVSARYGYLCGAVAAPAAR